MKITFLGTGTSMGVPVICCNCAACTSDDSRDMRLRTALLIETDTLSIVIDAGPDFRQQMLREKVHKIDALLITHSHKDHTAGLDDVRAYNYFMNRPVDVYGSEATLDALKSEFSYVFTTEKYPGAPDINLISIENRPFRIQNTVITPVKGLHYKMEVFGFRIGDLTYITDFNHISEQEEEKIKGSQILIINALRKKKHLTHFNLDEALAVISRVKPQQAFLTHISHQMGLHRIVTPELPQNVSLAYDGLKIIV